MNKEALRQSEQEISEVEQVDRLYRIVKNPDNKKAGWNPFIRNMYHRSGIQAKQNNLGNWAKARMNGISPKQENFDHKEIWELFPMCMSFTWILYHP